MIQANTNLLNHFPPKTPEELQKTISYIVEAPLAENHWQILKGLYKKAEEAVFIELLIPLIEKIDKTSTSGLSSKYPKAPTIGYMKRRAARFLRQLSTKDEEKYVQICQALLQKQEAADFNYTQQWVVTDILLRHSNRYQHNRNGRGNIIQLDNKPNIARSEAFAPDIWGKHLDVIKAILNTPALAIEVYDFAIKTLMRHHEPIPALTNLQLIRFFIAHNVPWLKKVAVQQVFQHLNGTKTVKESLWAYAYFYAPVDAQKQFLAFWESADHESEAPSKLRQTFLQLLGKEANESTKASLSKAEFVKELAKVVAEQFAQKHQWSRRTQQALPFIVNDAQVIPYTFWLKYAGVIFKMKQEKLISAILSAIEKSSVSDIPKWLDTVPAEEVELLKQVQDICLQKIPVNFNRQQLEKWLFNENPNIAYFGWKIAAKHKQAKQIAQHMWGRLYYQGWNHQALQSMLCSEEGSLLFITHCKDRIRWMSWYKDTIIQIVQHAHLRVQERFRSHLVNWAKNDIWNWLSLIEQLDNRDRFLKSLGSQKKKLERLQWGLFNAFSNESDWVKQTIWSWIEKEQLHTDQDWTNSFVSNTINRMNQEQALQFIQNIQQHSNPHVSQAMIKGVTYAINENPYIINKVVEVVGAITQSLTPDTLIKCITHIQEDKWSTIEPHVYQYCISKQGAEFWIALLKLLPEQEEGSTLTARTMNNETIAATFYQITDASILEEQHPLLGELLFGWVQKQEVLFTPNSNLLYQALVHKITPIRQWATARTKTTEMILPFALRLMESQMPSAYALGQRFFERTPKGHEEELNYVLSLCDSPNETVRNFGIHFLQERKESFHNDIALQFLSEHTDPIIQSFVAKQLVQETPDHQFVQQFDKAVLYTKNQSRKAKELVKERVAQDLAIDAQVLLNIARGKGEGDKEWAIFQLTKLALSGKEIEGFALTS